MDFRLRKFDLNKHLSSIGDGEWLPLLDPDGNELAGITGKAGVRGIKFDGSHIGTDFVRMQPGAEFPPHVHEGEHQIYFMRGMGFVRIEGQDIFVRAGDVIHIPAELPHAVWVPDYAQRPLVFVATGHPHHEVHARDRMRLVEGE